MIRTLLASAAACCAENRVLSGCGFDFARSISFQIGDSSSAPKINRPNTEFRIPAKNMKRQPQASNESPVKINEVTKKEIEAKSAPMPTPPPLMKPDINPRQCGGTDSVPIVWVEATTPATRPGAGV